MEQQFELRIKSIIAADAARRQVVVALWFFSQFFPLRKPSLGPSTNMIVARNKFRRISSRWLSRLGQQQTTATQAYTLHEIASAHQVHTNTGKYVVMTRIKVSCVR